MFPAASVSRRLLCQLFRTFFFFFFSHFEFLTGLKKLHFFFLSASFPFLCAFSSFLRDKDTVLEPAVMVVRESQARSFRTLYQLH